MNWKNWEPEKRAVVTYITEGERVLLMHKKRGLGQGKVNVPGGHIEEEETPEEAAIRETREEVHLDVSDLKLMGLLHFQFTDGLKMKGWVYHTKSYSGEERETEEADPFWCAINEIPYDRMWEDDIYWLPQMFKGRYFRAFFVFDGDKMTERKLFFYDSEEEFHFFQADC